MNELGESNVAGAAFTSIERAGLPVWPSPAVRMEIWATVLGSEVATATIALFSYDWSILQSPLP